jgi:hypothetical protein
VIPYALKDDELDIDKNNNCRCCSKSNEVPLIDKFKTVDLLLQIMHRLLLWTNYFLIVVVISVLGYYIFQGV